MPECRENYSGYWKYRYACTQFLRRNGLSWDRIYNDDIISYGRQILCVNDCVRRVHIMQALWTRNIRESATTKEDLLLLKGLRHCNICKKDVSVNKFGVLSFQGKNTCVDCARRIQRERMRYYYYTNPEWFNKKYRKRLREI